MNLRCAAPFFLSVVVACSTAQNEARRDTPQPEPANAPAALTLAHEAYLAGDFVALGERLEEVIVDPQSGELARDNAFALLDSAYDATHGQLPARTTLPKTISNMTFGVLHGAFSWGAHRLIFLNMRVAEGRGAHVKDIRVTRLPNEPLLSLADKRGTLKITPDEVKGFEYVKLEVRDLDALPERGAFSIRVTFDDGAPGIDTFVLGSKLVASTQPEVISPAAGQVLNDPQPEVAWRPFRSPELASWETRAVGVEITRDATTNWSFYKWEPGDLGNVRVGASDTGPSTTLQPSSYWLSLYCAEERTFGGIRISRATQTGRPFSVVQ